jgi:hypothetical protein
MQIVYLDSLEVDEVVQSEEECPIHAAAWNDKLIQAVMKKDTKGDGEFGKLRVSFLCFHISCSLFEFFFHPLFLTWIMYFFQFKQGVGATIRDSLFVGMTRTEDFVSSKLPRSFPNEVQFYFPNHTSFFMQSRKYA